LNYLKHMQHPAFLSHLSEFARSEKTEAVQVRVLNRVTNTALIRLKVPLQDSRKNQTPVQKGQVPERFERVGV
jgi:hypothetical protein